MESYRTEEEQVEALRRWWQENGRSTIAAIVIGVSLTIGYQTWQGNQSRSQAQASDLYQQMLQALGSSQDASLQQEGTRLAEQLKSEFEGTTYAQFASLHLARMAVGEDDLAGAEAELRWVLGKADKGSDVAQLAQLRLARVVAAVGDSGQALSILEDADAGNYRASYAMARGDILLGEGRAEEARLAYSEALSLAASNPGQVNLLALQQKLQSLNPVPARDLSQLDAENDKAPVVPADEILEAMESTAESAATPREQEG